MEDFDGDDLDLRLREALEPRPETVERIVRGALSPRPPVRRPRLVPALPVLAALAVAAGLLVLAPHPRRQAAVSIENVGDLMVVRRPGEQEGQEGGRWLIQKGLGQKGLGESPAPSRSLIVIYGNGDKP